MLTGQKAFSGDNYFSVMYKITNEDPAPIRELRPEVPEVLVKTVKKALAKDASQRYQSCADFAYDLRVALRGLRGTVSKANVEDVADYIHSVPFFESFTKEQVREFMHTSNIIKVRKGKVVVAEGEIDDAFYIILSGKARVRKNNKNIALLERGECFGEMAYISGQSRAATVQSDTDCILMKISATLLDKASERIQLLFLRNFALTLVRRLSRDKESENLAPPQVD